MYHIPEDWQMVWLDELHRENFYKEENRENIAEAFYHSNLFARPEGLGRTWKYLSDRNKDWFVVHVEHILEGGSLLDDPKDWFPDKIIDWADYERDRRYYLKEREEILEYRERQKEQEEAQKPTINDEYY